MKAVPEVLHRILKRITADLIRSYKIKLDVTQDFWLLGDVKAVEDGFFDLADELRDLELSFEVLPRGYYYVRYLFSFESAMSAEGWAAFEGFDYDEIGCICKAYWELGLVDESVAIKLAYDENLATDGDLQSINGAYNRQVNKYSDEMIRIPFIVEQLIFMSDAIFYDSF